MKILCRRAASPCILCHFYLTISYKTQSHSYVNQYGCQNAVGRKQSRENERTNERKRNLQRLTFDKKRSSSLLSASVLLFRRVFLFFRRVVFFLIFPADENEAVLKERTKEKK